MHSERLLPVPHSVHNELSVGLQRTSIHFKWREREYPLPPGKKSEMDFLQGYHVWSRIKMEVFHPLFAC
jgi:hypothetical protein